MFNVDPDPGRIQDNKIIKFISNHLLKVKKKKIIFKSVPKATFLVSYLKNIIFFKKLLKIVG